MSSMNGAKYKDKGTLITGGFDVKSPTPLDNRIIVATRSNLAGIFTISLYNGMIIYIEDEAKYLSLKTKKGVFADECEWVDITSGSEIGLDWNEI